MSDGWYRASARWATFGFEVRDGLVVHCAPYGRRGMMGRPVEHVLQKLRRHGYEVDRLGAVEPTPPDGPWIGQVDR